MMIAQDSMPFKPGDPKPPNSGRKKGVTNRWHPPDVRQVLSEDKIDPVRSIIALLPKLHPEKQLDAWKFLTTTAFPRSSEPVYPPTRDVPPLEAGQIPSAQLLESVTNPPPEDDEAEEEAEVVVPPPTAGAERSGS